MSNISLHHGDRDETLRNLRAACPWATEAMLVAAMDAARATQDAWGEFNDGEAILVQPCLSSGPVIDALKRTGFKSVSTVNRWLLTKDRAREVRASDPDAQREFKVHLYQRGERLPSDIHTAESWHSAAAWATERLTDPDFDFTRAEIDIYDGRGELLASDTVRVTVEKSTDVRKGSTRKA